MREADQELGYSNEAKESSTFTWPLRGALGRFTHTLRTFYSDERGYYKPGYTSGGRGGAGCMVGYLGVLAGMLAGIAVCRLMNLEPESYGKVYGSFIAGGAVSGLVLGICYENYIERHFNE